MTDADKARTLDAILAEFGPGGARMLQRISAASYRQFVKALHHDIEAILVDMERNRERFLEFSEDQLTFHISSILIERGYTASCGRQQSGSVDLTVQRIAKGYVWTAEAKIYKQLDNIREGFLQLSTRYSPGDFEEAHTGMLIYVQTANALEKLQTWRSDVTGRPNTTVRDAVTRPQLSFESIQVHDTSGLEFEVKHWIVALYFKPQDKSGRTAKRYNS